MLKQLRVKNYILIKELEFNPDSDLVVITGETGAGKSIILGAISLLLGQRADSKTLFDENKKCVIEGVFDIKNYKLKELFIRNEWDYFDECIIRREINPAGRTRAFINDSPVNLNDLKGLIENLVDVHSQNESILVNDVNYQLDIIDAYAQNFTLLEKFKTSFSEFRKIQNALNDLIQKKSEAQKEEDYKSFLFKELDEASLVENEKENLETELEINENAENIKQHFNSFLDIMDTSELNAGELLKEAQNQLQRLSSYSKEYSAIAQRFQSAIIEIDDIVKESQDLEDKLEMDPERLNHLRERVNLIQRLESKHHVLSFNNLLEIRDKLDLELQDSVDLDSKIEDLKKQLKESEIKLNESAEALSQSRKSISEELSDKLQGLLMNLGIEDANVDISVNESQINRNGKDLVQILFSANKGQAVSPLKDAASGGEISRIMLAIKYLIADKKALPTIIFDEIDTGISGKIAIQMGTMFQKIANSHQVISITHLPQIAAKGKVHYVVYKNSEEDKTKTEMRRLSGEERIIEIAQMISGNRNSVSAIESAKELLEHN
jgi:DNA repair protein RecN (Recombination protein N)